MMTGALAWIFWIGVLWYAPGIRVLVRDLVHRTNQRRFSMLGHGKVPWPFVRRSRFIRELKSQGDAYRANVWAAERLESRARHELQEAKQHFANAVTTLGGWRDEDGTTVQVVTPDNTPPQHFRMRTAYDVRGCRTRFVYDVSDEMLYRLTTNSTTAGVVLHSVTEQLVKEAILELAERGWRL